jgi:hypothetical protein
MDFNLDCKDFWRITIIIWRIMNRRTIENIKKSGLVIEREEDLLSDIVKLIVERLA